jgi:hypothetical protein
LLPWPCRRRTDQRPLTGASWSIRGARAETLATFTDISNDFAVEREVDGQRFRASYQNFLETRVATIGLRVRF